MKHQLKILILIHKKMNKIFILLISVILFCSCDKTQITNGDQDGVSLIELSVKGDTCEYILYNTGGAEYATTGMSHWTKCKYCAARNSVRQNEIRVLTKDCVEVTIYYTGDEISTNTQNDIRAYFHNYLIKEINTEKFEDDFYNIYHLNNCKFDYNIK